MVVNIGDVIVTGAVVCESAVVSGAVVVVAVVSEVGGIRDIEGIELSVTVVAAAVVTVVPAVVPVSVPVDDVSGASPVTVKDENVTFILPIIRPQGIFCALSQSSVYLSPPQLPV